MACIRDLHSQMECLTHHTKHTTTQVGIISNICIQYKFYRYSVMKRKLTYRIVSWRRILKEDLKKYISGFA